MNAFKKAYTPIKLGGLTLKNRFIKTATYEGMCHKGIPTHELTNLHSRIASGGIALTNVAYGAVNPEGTTHAHQMYLRPEIIPRLKELTKSVRKNGSESSIQLTHCGFFSKNKNIPGKRPLSASRVLNKYGLLSGLGFSKSMTVGEIKNTVFNFGNAASLAIEAGFDAIEIHMGHGYLLSQFLSPAINKRTDNYGGNLQNRMRFPLEVLSEVRKRVGDDYPVFCKINLSDDFNGGLTIDESIILAQRLKEHSANALVLSGGYTSKTPFFLMRGGIPVKEMIKAEKSYPQKLALLMFGKSIIKKYEFEENFFLPLSLRIREAVDMPLVYLGGVVSNRGIDEVMHHGFDMIAIGRALIHDPDFVKNVYDNEEYISPCDHCNICVAEMDINGIRCVLQ